MELEKFEKKQVAEISELQQRSNQLQEVADKITVDGQDSLKEANQLVKDINAHKKLVKEKRLALTQPLNNVISELISKEKEVLLPLDEGKTAVSDKILTYQEEVERLRRQEEQRLDAINDKIIDHYDMRFSIKEIDDAGANLKKYYDSLDENDKNSPVIKVAFMQTVGKLTDRKNQIIEEERAEAERKRQSEEQAKLDAAKAKQSEEEARIAAERQTIENEKRRIEDEKLQMQREKEELQRAKDIQKAEAEQLRLQKKQSKESGIKTNAVELTKVEVYEENLVPREYCSPDMVKIRAAVKANKNSGMFEIPGVKLVTEKKVR